jgi:hypothetical protein
VLHGDAHRRQLGGVQGLEIVPAGLGEAQSCKMIQCVAPRAVRARVGVCWTSAAEEPMSIGGPDAGRQAEAASGVLGEAAMW